VPVQSGLQGHDLTRVLYLHGFASSAHSTKASFFKEKLAGKGITMVVPDLNEPDFSTLTVSRMLQQAAATIEIDARDEPIAVIGSSLGGFVAVQLALRYRARVQRVVLLAPALDFDGNRLSEVGDRGLADWKASNELQVFHYGYGRLISVHYGLYEDSRQYNSLDAALTQPVQVFQGRYDKAVDPATVERWAAARPNVELHMLDDDHQLYASLNYIWKEVERFITSRFPDSPLESPRDPLSP
jgi:pimeloyl-ACP methyl ester carboxylesterase